MKAQHAAILGVYKDATVSLGDAQGQLNHLLLRHSFRSAASDIRDTGKSHVVWYDCV